MIFLLTAHSILFNVKPQNKKFELSAWMIENTTIGRIKMKTDYNTLVPQGVLFNLKQIEEFLILRVDMAKKLIAKGDIEVVKIGNKIHISRTELIRYLEAQTIPASN